MPEAPEIRRATDWLKSKLNRDGRWLNFMGIALLSDSKKHAKIDLTVVAKALKLPVVEVFCQSKHMFIVLGEEVIIHAHFLMGGRWNDQYEQGAHFRLTFQDPETEELVKIYYESKKFGFLELLDGGEALAKVMDKLAPDFLGINQIDEEIWMQRFQKFTKRKNLRMLLFDQEALVGGIGNYLLCQIFYEAKLHWKTIVGDLTEDKKRELFHICEKIIVGFYEGTAQKTIYKQKIDPLGNEIVPVTMSNGRTFWSVPNVQGPN